jgi:two-component system, NarL family, nitrate/nitrite response regulator NarL
MELSPRQYQVCGLLSQGRTNKQIATELGIGVGTVKVYIARAFLVLRVTTRLELALYYVEHDREKGQGSS